MKYKVWLFDWDGTIGDTLPLWFKTFKEVFALCGVEASYEEIGNKVLGDWMGPAKLGVVDVEGFFEEMEERLLDKLPAVNLNDGVKELLVKIKNSGGKVGVVTTSKRKYVEKAMENNGLIDLVEVFLGKEDVVNHKPDPEIILKAMKVLEVEPGQVIMVGDSLKDVEAAEKAGVYSVLYYPSKYHEFYGEKRRIEPAPDEVIEMFLDLEKYL